MDSRYVISGGKWPGTLRIWDVEKLLDNGADEQTALISTCSFVL